MNAELLEYCKQEIQTLLAKKNLSVRPNLHGAVLPFMSIILQKKNEEVHVLLLITNH